MWKSSFVLGKTSILVFLRHLKFLYKGCFFCVSIGTRLFNVGVWMFVTNEETTSDQLNSWKLSCVPMSATVTNIVITFTTHNIEIPWRVHHIQTKNWYTCNNVGIQAQNIKNQNICIIKKTTNRNYVLESQITKSDLSSHKMGLYPMTNISIAIHI